MYSLLVVPDQTKITGLVFIILFISYGVLESEILPCVASLCSGACQGGPLYATAYNYSWDLKKMKRQGLMYVL